MTVEAERATPSQMPEDSKQIAIRMPKELLDRVDAYAKKYNGDMPSGYAAYQYNAVKAWAEAVEKAGTIDAKAVAAKLEGMQFDYSAGKSFIRKCDHQLFQAAHIMKGRAETQGAQGFRDFVLSIEPDDKYERSCQELGLG